VALDSGWVATEVSCAVSQSFRPPEVGLRGIVNLGVRRAWPSGRQSLGTCAVCWWTPCEAGPRLIGFRRALRRQRRGQRGRPASTSGGRVSVRATFSALWTSASFATSLVTVSMGAPP